MSEKVSTAKNLVKGFIQENPLFVLMLGTCPALATTKSIESAIGMGMLVIFVLTCSNVIISLLKRIIPDAVRIPCFIVVIATFVIVVELVCKAFLPDLYSSLGVFISLIVVNCVILGRAEAFASKNSVGASFIDGIGIGIGFMFSLVIMAFFRETLGTGGIEFGHVLPLGTNSLGDPIIYGGTPLKTFAISVMTDAPGGFLVFGILMAIFPYLGKLFNKKEKAGENK